MPQETRPAIPALPRGDIESEVFLRKLLRQMDRETILAVLFETIPKEEIERRLYSDTAV